MAADLDVALLHQVEKPHLDTLGQVRQLVDAEDAAVGARDEAEVDGQLVREVPALGHLDGVDLADEVGDRDVGRRQLLGVPLVPRQPVDLEVVTLLGEPRPATEADGVEGVVVDLAAAHHRRLLVEEGHQAADDARLGLSALAQEDDVLPGEYGVLHLGNDRVLIPHDAGEQGAPLAHAGHQVPADLLPDGQRPVAGLAELAEGGRLLRVSHACLLECVGTAFRWKVYQSCIGGGACQPSGCLAEGHHATLSRRCPPVRLKVAQSLVMP